MSTYYSINVDEYFSSYKFYNSLLPQLHEYFSEHTENKKLLINLEKINKLSPLVIPNLLNTGLILKDYFNEPVEMFIPWNRKLLAYLRDVNFFQINMDHNIFKIDERYTGDIPINRSISDICGTLLIPNKQSKDSIFNCYLNKYLPPLMKQLGSEKTVSDILYIMAELSHNGARHSEGSCFVSFQLNKLNKFEFSVSDCGIGYKKSFGNKQRDLIFKNKKSYCDNDSNQVDHFISILEAIFYRKINKEKIYGVYSIFNDILPINGIIRMHTYNTQAIFTGHNFRSFLDNNPNKEILENILKQFVTAEGKARNPRHKPLRISPVKFRGVHIEIEIPLNGQNTRS